jgi:hypothetical protein
MPMIRRLDWGAAYEIQYLSQILPILKKVNIKLNVLELTDAFPVIVSILSLWLLNVLPLSSLMKRKKRPRAGNRSLLVRSVVRGHFGSIDGRICRGKRSHTFHQH